MCDVAWAPDVPVQSSMLAGSWQVVPFVLTVVLMGFWVGTHTLHVHVQYGTRKRLRSVLLARHMYACIVSNYAGTHGVNTIERRYGINYRV